MRGEHWRDAIRTRGSREPRETPATHGMPGMPGVRGSHRPRSGPGGPHGLPGGPHRQGGKSTRRALRFLALGLVCVTGSGMLRAVPTPSAGTPSTPAGSASTAPAAAATRSEVDSDTQQRRPPSARDGDAPAPSGKRTWPVKGRTGAPRPLVVHGWKPPPEPWAAGHRGVDLAAPRGSPVRAVADGTVSFAGTVAGRGVVSVELSGTGRPPLRTTYEPVRASVRKGDRVRAGQIVGTISDGPRHCRSTCLHWGVRRAERYIDPLSLLPAGLLRGGPSRLLPVFGVPLPRGASTKETTGKDADQR